MFDPQEHPRAFALPIGVDFPRAVVDGLRARMLNQPPEALARVVLYVNTTRMQRRIRSLFIERGATLLPQVRLVTDLASDLSLDLPVATDGLARRLQLAQLVRQLINADPSLAAHDSAFDLADSLAALFEEMTGEDVSPEDIAKVDVANHSAYWARSQKFIELVQHFLGPEAPMDVETRQRAVVETLAAKWQSAPPDHPVIVAGSTGSRGTTRTFMRAVAALPQGALILPGFDRDMPARVWEKLDDEEGGQDHPQFRYFTLAKELGLDPTRIPLWTDDAPHAPDRNALISLALRPAPVTDAWLSEGPALESLLAATTPLTLIEAQQPRQEVLAIALRLRKAAEDGTAAALISPDQTLARQVTAALSAWDIVPNDSAGARLDLSPPGRLLRMTASLMGGGLAPDQFLGLLKHPLVCASDRKAHLARVRDLEVQLLRGGPPEITPALMETWVEARTGTDLGVRDWHDWLWSCLLPLTSMVMNDISTLVDEHLTQTDRLTMGPDSTGGQLWLREAGEEALKWATSLREAAPSGGSYTPSEYADLVAKLLAKQEVREPFYTHRDIMVWGTLEARVQGAELLILAGLNDGTWPSLPEPDPWLNRAMRKDAGLRLPDARIGLSAHDFQQSIAAKEVWLTRSLRDAEAETVPSRWLNRIGNLMQGLAGEGPEAYRNMQARGNEWLRLAKAYDTPRITLEPAPRPSPQPPVEARPKQLSVTRIETLIRDPYAVYARYILDLKPLKLLHAEADAALRGQVIHDVLHTFIAAHPGALPEDADDQLLACAAEMFERHIAWPATRRFWLQRFSRAIPWFIATERARRTFAMPAAFERDGKRTSARLGFTLHGRADRIDRDEAGALAIYDYKTGQLPTNPQQKHFNKQLSLLAAIGAGGGFDGLAASHVKQTAYIGLGSNPEQSAVELAPDEIDDIWTKFEGLIAAYMDSEKGYSSRRAVYEERWDQDYDLLARWGEWSRSDEATPIPVSPEGEP